MAESKAEATKFECDAPKCDVVHVVVGDDKPKGRRLTSEGPTGEPVRVYACKPTHYRPAIEAAEERAENEARGTQETTDVDEAKASFAEHFGDDVDADEALGELEDAGRPVAVGQ